MDPGSPTTLLLNSPCNPHKRYLPLSPSHLTSKAKKRRLRRLVPSTVILAHTQENEQTLRSCSTFLVPSVHRTPIHHRFVHVHGGLRSESNNGGRRNSQTANSVSPSSPTIVTSQDLFSDIFTENRKYKCKRCGGKHAVNKCTYADRKCLNCDETGHEQWDCPLKIKEKRASMGIIPLSRPKGKLLTIEEKRMAARVYYELVAETAVHSVSTKSALLRASTYTGLSKKVLEEIRMEWEINQEFADVPSGRQRDQKNHWSRHWISDIRKIVIDLNAGGIPVSVKKVVNEMNISLKDYGLVLNHRTCIRLLQTMGFRYDWVRKAINFQETNEIKEWRERYLRHRDNVKDKRPDAIELWLDESYCNQHYAKAKSWFRTGDLVQRGNRGRRWVILHCGGADGWIGQPLVFESISSEGDYHKSMNAEVFEKYFTELCSEIVLHYSEERLQKGVYIYMDNAAYHKRVEGLTGGVSKMKKKELINWMKQCDARLSEDVFEGKTKKEIYSIYRREPHRYKGTPMVEEISKRFGIQVVWLPPYHPMLNPIELAWSIVKGHVADINDGKNFQKVGE